MIPPGKAVAGKSSQPTMCRFHMADDQPSDPERALMPPTVHSMAAQA
jgi:hypothetical protein